MGSPHPPCHEGDVEPWSRALARSHSGLGSLGGLSSPPFGISQNRLTPREQDPEVVIP